ncbi:MAG: FMN-binding negative transcriptional regulator [Gammaproteobacteria bacterium]|nr:MAG: FMN-binding negative transcriptional regulator [Gammaproteobacteria bacterium]
MYQPGHFAETRIDALHELMRAYPFATVVANATNCLDANHLPFELVDGVLQGHVARGNALAAANGAKVLVIFQGPHGYVSPNWYPSKRETGRVVPTWNYAVAHVHGRLRTIQDELWLRALLERLTIRHESTQPVPWRVDDAPADYVQKLFGAIVGIEIAIDRIEGKFKLSQNHPLTNRMSVIEGLRERAMDNDARLAEWMTKSIS